VTLRRLVGYVALTAGVVDEVLLLLEQGNIVREIVPKWLGNQVTVIALLVVGFLAVIVNKEPHSAKESGATASVVPTTPVVPTSPVTVQVTQTASPTITQTNAPTTSLTQDAPPIRRKAQSNIKCVGAKNIWASQDVSRLSYFEASPGEYRLSVVCFRNEAAENREVSEPYVRAHVIYRDSTGSEITDLARGVWLDERSDVIQLGLGERKCVIVLLRGARNSLLKIWKEHQVAEWGENLLPRDEQIPIKPASIEVQLISGDTGTLLIRAIIEVGEVRDSGLPDVSLRGPVKRDTAPFIAESDRSRIIEALSRFTGRLVDIVKHPDDADVSELARQLLSVLRDSGWNPRMLPDAPTEPLSGIAVEVARNNPGNLEAGNALVSAFAGAGLVVKGPSDTLGLTQTGAAVRITVGRNRS
jgi:hypothetical protein